MRRTLMQMALSFVAGVAALRALERFAATDEEIRALDNGFG